MDIMFFSDKSIIYIAEYIRSHIIESFKEDRKISYWDGSLCISSKYYDVAIESSLNYIGSETWKVLNDICNDYDIDINTSVSIDIYSKTYSTGIINARNLAKKLLEIFPGDALITDDSGSVLYKKRSGTTVGII